MDSASDSDVVLFVEFDHDIAWALAGDIEKDDGCSPFDCW